VRTVLLFDIDNTLLYTGGAGSHAFNATFEALHGVSDAFRGIAFAGRTDRAILRDGFLKHGVAIDTDGQFEAALAAFQALYHDRLDSALGIIRGGAVLPGVVPLLERLSCRQDAYLGLATGNFRRSALQKLEHYGIARYFLDGGFADEAEDRAHLVRAAARRLLDHPDVPPGAHRVVVLGDTPYDIDAARANGFVAVGVATGGSSAADLERAGADHVFDDLADTDAVEHVLMDDHG
jgi:phosphoglycolate phosphatase-like HAD superfamily hydrolase